MGSWKHSGSLNIEMSNREIENAKFARKAAGEGIVLLKNEGVLPLKENIKISLLGIGAKKTIKGGIGSGDVNNRESISIYQGLKSAGAVIVSEGWLEDYENRYKAAREIWKERILEEAKHVDNPFDAYAENPFLLPEGRKIGEKEIEGADVVVYVVSRISGEGKDRRKVKGDYYLSEREEEDLTYLNQKEIPVVLILNAGGPVEITDILENTENTKTVLNITQSGQGGGNAVADVLFGDYNPAGRLTISVPRSVGQLPVYYNTKRKGNRSKYIEEEGTPRYPFGYGLSYTSFNYSDLKAEVVEAEDSCLVNISVKVRNEGSRDGDEVVQLYLRDEVASFTTPFKQLCGFQRIHLKVGETKEITFRLDKKSLALYMQNEEWAVEPGRFTLMLGGSSEQIYQQKEIEITKRYTFKM